MDNDTLGVLSALLSNPDTMAKIGGVISKYTSSENRDNTPQNKDFETKFDDFSNNKGNDTPISDKESPTEENQENSEIAPVPSSKKVESRANENDQIALLLAIRPYLSERRRDMIDTFVRLSKMGNIFKNFL